MSLYQISSKTSPNGHSQIFSETLVTVKQFMFNGHMQSFQLIVKDHLGLLTAPAASKMHIKKVHEKFYAN